MNYSQIIDIILLVIYMLEVGSLYKHFKGDNLVEKNIIKILAINPKYTGTSEYPDKNYVVYESIFQKGKCFIREYEDLVDKLEEEKKKLYKQDHRIEKLNDEELELIKDENFIKEKLEYLDNKSK